MTNIIFLDVDGPLLPARAYIGQKESIVFLAWDPVAVAIVNTLIDEVKAKLVISSTWASMGKENFSFHLTKNGIDPKYLHEDWRTPRRLTSLRATEVSWWLQNHPEIDNWISFDDDYVSGDGAIRVTFNDGIQFKHYVKARKILGLKEKHIL